MPDENHHPATTETAPEPAELARLRLLAAAFAAITSDGEAIGMFSRSAQQDIRMQGALWRRRLANATGVK